MELLLGHTPQGEPVTLWTQTNAWTGRVESFLTIGRTTFELDHIALGLTEAMTASLHPEVAAA